MTRVMAITGINYILKYFQKEKLFKILIQFTDKKKCYKNVKYLSCDTEDWPSQE